MQFVQFVRDAIGLLFPELCAGCRQVLVNQENQLCTNCIYNLPKTDFHLDPDNLAARQLMGRVPVSNVSSFLYFTSGSIVQEIIHHIKYKNGFVTAELMGRLYGQQLKDSREAAEYTVIIPVPLHTKRLRSRGYNQSEHFAKGLSKELNIGISTDNLIRKTHNKSQTKNKTRYDRYENTKDIFEVKNLKLLENQHVLLVDDVLTTGATLEGCSRVLLQIPNVKVSIATIAFAK